MSVAGIVKDCTSEVLGQLERDCFGWRDGGVFVRFSHCLSV